MANSLRIAHLDFSREWRGGQQQLLLLARGFRALGWEQMIVARGGETAERLRAAGFAVTPPGFAAARAVRGARIGHAHDGHAHTFLLQATLGTNNLRVLSRRVAFPIAGRASAWKYRKLDLIIAVSDAVRRQVLTTGVPPEHVAVIPDGLDFDQLPAPEPTRQRLRQLLRLDSAQRLLVCLGAFTPEKGIADLLGAMPCLPDHCHLLLSGDGPERAALERQARSLAGPERVHFAIHTAATPVEWVAAADIFVMPSRQEGLGSAALLAMALERPIVASAVGGIPELIADGATGLLVPPGDPYALAQACLRLLQDPDLGTRLTVAARHQVHDRHDIRVLAAATQDAYRRALGDDPQGSLLL